MGTVVQNLGPTTDWRNYPLVQLALLDDPVLSGSLESLRSWVDAASPVGDSPDGPDGRLHRLVMAEDLLHVPRDRRNACFSELRCLVLSVRCTLDHPEEFVRGALEKTGKSVSQRRFRQLVDAARGNVKLLDLLTLRWIDDGRDDLGLKEPVHRFV
jgi:hypothetical protein